MTTPRPRPARFPDQDEYRAQTAGPPPDQGLPWATVRRWLEEARYYWLATTRRDGRPHGVPLWAVWLADSLWFSTSPQTASARNLARRPYAVAHPESATEVVVLEGAVARPAPDTVSLSVIDTYEAKYGRKMDPADPDLPFFALKPRLAFAWLAANVGRTATCWDFD